jgi:hypothetical protein
LFGRIRIIVERREGRMTDSKDDRNKGASSSASGNVAPPQQPTPDAPAFLMQSGEATVEVRPPPPPQRPIVDGPDLPAYSTGPVTGPIGPRYEATPTGKYLHINVPNFNNASDAEPLGTYLRMGAVADPHGVASPDAPSWTGEDLAAEVTSFIDDTRLRDGCPDFVSEEERQAETAKLHSKGGWRSHTDGNRIDTTRGDKVEVVAGNYKMVILGRRHDAAGWDVSGGHVSESGITFEGAGSIEYTTEDYGGTWVVVEKTVKGHVHTAYHGKVFDYYCGEIVESITGTDTPSAVQPNPVVVDKTWAASITSYTGSATLPIPLISQETWADVITDKSTVTTMTSETTVETMSSTTTAGSITDSTTADTIDSTTTADAITDTTTASTMTSTTTCGLITDTITGVSITTIIGMETEMVLGDMKEITIGSESSTTIGDTTSVNIGTEMSLVMAMEMSLAMSLAMSMTLGLSLDVFVGGKIDINASITLSIAPIDINIDVIKLFF